MGLIYMFKIWRMDIPVDRSADISTDRNVDRQTDRSTDRHAYWKTAYRQTDRQTCRATPGTACLGYKTDATFSAHYGVKDSIYLSIKASISLGMFYWCIAVGELKQHGRAEPVQWSVFSCMSHLQLFSVRNEQELTPSKRIHEVVFDLFNYLFT